MENYPEIPPIEVHSISDVEKMTPDQFVDYFKKVAVTVSQKSIADFMYSKGVTPGFLASAINSLKISPKELDRNDAKPILEKMLKNIKNN